MNPGKISVIIPTYNRADLLPRALDSVLAQTLPPNQIIVVDDGSTDNTSEVIKPYRQRGIQYIKKQNGGASSARNLGLEMATGQFLSFLDSDDQWQPDFLSQTFNILQKYPSAAAAFTDATRVCDNQIVEPSVNWSTRRKCFRESLKIEKKGFTGCFDCDTFRQAAIQVCLIIMSAILIRAEAFKKTGDFDIDYKVSEDYELWLRMSRYFPFCYIDQSLTFYNIHSGNLTQQPELQELFRRNNRRALQKELNWEQDPKFRRIIEDQIRQNWETELFHQLAQADKTQLQQTLNDARSQGWCSTKKSMRRIKILDHTGPSTTLIINKLLKGLGR